jgi:hypothetical protein
MHVEFDCPDHAAIIERLLDGFISAGELLIRAGAVGPPELEMVLQDDDVASWQLPTQSAEKKTGDCEDLVIWWAAWLRATGKHPHARARIKNTGPMQVHCCLDLGNGKVVDVYAEHLQAQERAGFKMGGWWSSVKNAVKSVGHGIATAGKAVGNAAESTYHGVKDAAHYVAHDLPGAIIHEGASGLKDLAGNIAGGVADVVHGIGGAGSTIINAVGDEVAHGAGDALHQWGKLGGAVVNSFSGGLGDDVPQRPDAGDAGGGDAPQGAPGDFGAAGGGEPYEGPDPFTGDDFGADDGSWSEDEADAAGSHFDDDGGM